MQAKARELDLQLEMLVRPHDAVVPHAQRRALRTGRRRAGRAGRADPGDRSAARPDRPSKDRRLAADAFAQRAEAELDHYRVEYPDLSVFVEVRDDCTEVMVANGVLLVPASASVPEPRAEALLQHEVGTHALTYANGSAQPLRLLAAGLAGYEGTQEGLALARRTSRRRLRRAPTPPDRRPRHRGTPDARRRDIPRSLRLPPSNGIAAACRLCDHDASLPLGWPHQGRRVPARTLRSARLPGRRRLARHVVAGQDAAHLGPVGAALFQRRASTTPASLPRYLGSRSRSIGSGSRPAKTPST